MVAAPGPLTPTHALGLTIIALVLGSIWLVAAPINLLVSQAEAIAWFVVVEFLCFTCVWNSIRRETYTRWIRAWNRFMGVVICLLIIVTIIQWNAGNQPFPAWATGIGLIFALHAIGRMSYGGIINFRNWIQGADSDRIWQESRHDLDNEHSNSAEP